MSDTPLTLALARFIVAQPPPPRAVAEWHAVRDAMAHAAAPTAPAQPAGGSALAPLAPEAWEAVRERAAGALRECMNGSPPVYVMAGTPHPYGGEAWTEVTDGVGRVFPCRDAAVRWLKAMGREA